MAKTWQETIIDELRMHSILADERDKPNKSIVRAMRQLAKEQAEITWKARDPEIAEWVVLLLQVLRKIGVCNSDTDPSIAEVIMAANELLKSNAPLAEARIAGATEERAKMNQYFADKLAEARKEGMREERLRLAKIMQEHLESNLSGLISWFKALQESS